MISGAYQNKDVIKSILYNHGYSFQDHENYISCSANFRGIMDTSAVVIYHKDDRVIDFAGGFKGNVKEFLQLVTNQVTQENLDKYLQNNSLELTPIDITPKIKQPKIFDRSLLSYIDVNNNDYFIKRGISEETCRKFGAGYVGDVKGKMRFKQTIPIFNEKGEINGFTGRSLDNNSKIKWQHSGSKTDWLWPIHINGEAINKTKSVILVESPLCVMSLYDCGVRNVLCLFSIELSYTLLNYFLRNNIEKIILSTNYEPDNLLKNTNIPIGENGALKAYKRLSRFFDKSSLFIMLPEPYKDFNDAPKEWIRNEWLQKVKLTVGEKYFIM